MLNRYAAAINNFNLKYFVELLFQKNNNIKHDFELLSKEYTQFIEFLLSSFVSDEKIGSNSPSLASSIHSQTTKRQRLN